jgi:uncharacterized protein YjbJ (UPF0337 family)
MTATRQIASGHWNEIKGKLQEAWGQLTDEELDRVKGDTNQLIGLVQRKTGKSREAVEDFLDNLTHEGQNIWQQATGTVREYAATAGHAIQDTANVARDKVQEGIEYTGEMVRTRPMESLAVCFGTGLVAGVILGLLVRR